MLSIPCTFSFLLSSPFNINPLAISGLIIFIDPFSYAVFLIWL